MFKKKILLLTVMLGKIQLPFQALLVFGTLLAILLTVIGIKNNLFFSFDQARDALEAYSIWHGHHVKILGPSTDIPGVFHGVLWYYALAIPFFFFNQPETAAIFFSTLLFIGAITNTLLVEKLFKNSYVSCITFLLYIMSPFFLMATHWLSNPLLSFLVTPFLLFFLWEYIEKQKSKSAFLVGISMGLLIQGEFGFLILLFSLPLYVLIFRVAIKLKDIVVFFTGLLLTLSTFLIAEIKFHFQGIKGIFLFLHNAKHGHFGIIDVLSHFITRNVDLFSTVVFPFPKNIVFILFGLFVLLLIFYCFKKDRKPLGFLSLWLGSLLLFQFFSSGISSSYFLFFPFILPVVAIVAYLLVSIFRNKLFLFITLCMLLFFQIELTTTYLKENYLIFTVEQGATLYSEKKIISYTYSASKNKPFTIITLTNPLYINTTWAYLYTHYGVSHGFVPFWGGRSQKGYLGDLPEKQFATNLRYLIIEPTQGIPQIYIEKIIYEEDKVSDIIEQKKFGAFIVQKRLFHPQKPLPVPPNMLLHSSILYEN